MVRCDEMVYLPRCSIAMLLGAAGQCDTACIYIRPSKTGLIPSSVGPCKMGTPIFNTLIESA